MGTSILKELEQILQSSEDGLLKAVDVVEYARDPETALHEWFTWDDGDAAHQYRLWQARRVIKVHVQIVNGHKEPVPVFVNLESTRHQPDGGYRLLSVVMADEELRRELLAQALREANQWRRKYRALKELEPVFASLDEVGGVVPLPIVAMTGD